MRRIRSRLRMPRVWGTFKGFMTQSVDDNKGIKGAILNKKQLKLLSSDVSWNYLVRVISAAEVVLETSP